MVVEAKFGAKMGSDQVRAYLANQEVRLDDGLRGALVLLVPSYREPEAKRLLDTLGDQADQHNASTTSIAAVVDTWERWLDVLSEAGQQLPAAKRAAVLCDLGQLRALCATMRGVDVPPLGLAARGRDFEEREDDLRRLVAEATARFRAPAGRLAPIGDDHYLGFYRRYIPGGLVEEPGCSCAVGVIGGLASEGETPFWLRYHRDTPGFQTIADRIMASQLAPDALGGEGHIWLPLHVSDDRSGAAIVEELCSQIEEIRAVAAGFGSA